MQSSGPRVTRCCASFQMRCWLHWPALWEKGLQRPLRRARPRPISVRLDCSGDRNGSDRCHLCGGPLYHKVSNRTWASPRLRAGASPSLWLRVSWWTEYSHPFSVSLSSAQWEHFKSHVKRRVFPYRTGTTYITHFYIKMSIVYVLRLFASLT